MKEYFKVPVRPSKSVTVNITGAAESVPRPLRTSVSCLALSLWGGAKVSTDGGEVMIRIANLRWNGSTYKGTIAAYRGDEKIGSQAFESDSEEKEPLQESMNKSLRKLATKLHVDLTPVTHITY